MGGRTLVACSGGCDSSALLIALASVTGEIVVAHIVHDLRPRAEALAGKHAAAELAEAFGLPFVSAEVAVRFPPGGNTEARARTARYRALATLAREQGCGFIATAHHADDQLETLLMALMRGSGPRGLSGVARSRRLGPPSGRPVRVIRPMLGTSDARSRPLTRADAERLCRAAGWSWQEDRTNADTVLLRNALRAEVLPVLRRLRPRSAEHAAAAAMIQHDLARLLDAAARDRAISLDARSGSPEAWPRSELRRLSPTLLARVLRARILNPTSLSPARGSDGESGEERPGADRLGRRTLGPLIRAIRDRVTHPRTFTFPASSLTVRVTANQVRFDKA
ncbi:MAG: tRNA lysidine(34) synthetase TilS [Phycisphaerales bacterium]|nr:tRNA lysidine(34) synthetase TilS [Phycisphaerales bacterium]